MYVLEDTRSVQFFSHVWLSVTPWTAVRQASLSITNSWSLANTHHVHWVGDAIQLSHPLSSPSPPAFSLSQHQVCSNESVLCIRQPKYWSFSFSISSSNSGLISFRIDWFDLLAVQGTLKSHFQHHNSNSSLGHFNLEMHILPFCDVFSYHLKNSSYLSSFLFPTF